jgi:hypothetical protein
VNVHHENRSRSVVLEKQAKQLENRIHLTRTSPLERWNGVCSIVLPNTQISTHSSTHRNTNSEHIMDSFSFGIIGLVIVISLISVVFAVGMSIFVFKKVFSPLMKDASNNSRILQSGEQAQARIVNIQDTGMLVNHNPRVRLLLEVRPFGRQPYQTELTTLVSHLAIPRVQPGCIVPIRIDPMNPQQVALAV